jgi:hypothetical protein
MTGDQLHVHHVFDVHTPTGAVTDATASAAQRQPLPRPTPPGPQDIPIAAASDVSCLTVHDPTSSPAVTIDPASGANIGNLKKLVI